MSRVLYQLSRIVPERAEQVPHESSHVRYFHGPPVGPFRNEKHLERQMLIGGSLGPCVNVCNHWPRRRRLFQNR